MTKNTTIKVTGTGIPAYFLGRPRQRYVAAVNSRQVLSDTNFARAA